MVNSVRLPSMRPDGNSTFLRSGADFTSCAVTPRKFDMRAKLTSALEHRPELAAAKLRRESSREQLRAAQSARLPDLTGTAGYGGQSSRLDSDSEKCWNVGVGLTLPLMTRGALQAGVDQARGGLQQSEA